MAPLSPSSEHSSVESNSPRTAAPDPRPHPPRQPELEDCCRSGCTPCVFDLYDAAVERYERALAAWLERHPEPD